MWARLLFDVSHSNVLSNTVTQKVCACVSVHCAETGALWECVLQSQHFLIQGILWLRDLDLLLQHHLTAVCSTLTQFKQNYLTIKYNKSPDDSPMTRTSLQLQTQSCCLTAAQSLDRSFWSLMSRRLFLSFDNSCRTRWRMEGRVREQGCASVSFPVK